MRLFCDLFCLSRASRYARDTPPTNENAVLLTDSVQGATRAAIRSLWLAQSQAVEALTDFVFGDEMGEERDTSLRLVGDAARHYVVRGSTLGGTASIVSLVTHLVSWSDLADKVLTLPP